jgi:hypothetical protein
VHPCVILTLERHFPTKSIQTKPWSPGRGKSALRRRSARPVGISMQKETTPLWVWLSVALLAIGALTYVTTVYLLEYVMTFF